MKYTITFLAGIFIGLGAVKAQAGPLHLEGSQGRTNVSPTTGIATQKKNGNQVADFVMQGELTVALEEVNTVTNHITEVTEVTEITNITETTVGVSEEDLAGALRQSYRYATKAAEEALSMSLAAGALQQASPGKTMVSVAGSSDKAVAIGVSHKGTGGYSLSISTVFKGDRKEGVVSFGYEF